MNKIENSKKEKWRSWIKKRKGVDYLDDVGNTKNV